MPEDQPAADERIVQPAADERVVRAPRLGTKISWLLGAVAMIGSAYFALVPLEVSVNGDSRWRCGTALRGPADAFGLGLCGTLNDVYLFRAGAWALLALVLIVGGTYLFGMDAKVVRTIPNAAEEI